MAFDLVIDVENTPGSLAQVAAAISDAGVNIAAATCTAPGERAELHILVPHAEAARHALAISHLAVTREREVVVVDVEDRPGVLADLTRKIARAGVDLELFMWRPEIEWYSGLPTSPLYGACWRSETDDYRDRHEATTSLGCETEPRRVLVLMELVLRCEQRPQALRSFVP